MPLVDINALVMQRGLVAMGIITVIFGLIFIIINALVKKSILLPINNITEASIVLSKGDLDHEIHIERDGSEIGELANSFELLRRSLKVGHGAIKNNNPCQSAGLLTEASLGRRKLINQHY